jgi:hypothetical protein
LISWLVVLTFLSCTDQIMGEQEFLARIARFERTLQDAGQDETQRELRLLADDLLHRVIFVQGAVVASPYRRGNTTHVYFGVDYDPDHYLYLADLDPEFQAFFERHEHWVSVIKTFDDRQFSYELAIDPKTFDRLDQGQPVSLTCELASVIRGKSVYCKMLKIEPLGDGRRAREHRRSLGPTRRLTRLWEMTGPVAPPARSCDTTIDPPDWGGEGGS